MIAAARRRIAKARAGVSGAVARWTRRVDRTADRGLERAAPALLRGRHRAAVAWRRLAAWLGPRVRPVAAAFFRALARAERSARRGGRALQRAATAASAVVTRQRAIAAVIVAAGICLVVSQFVAYRGVEIGQPGYAGLPQLARPPAVDVRDAGQAHFYLLVPLGLLAVCLGLVAGARERRRLGLAIAGLGLLAIALILAVDLPAGLDAGAQTSRFAGARAVLDEGFYAELAAAAGLVLGGLLYYARPCRIPINLSGRAASGRRRRSRRRASSRARVARSA